MTRAGMTSEVGLLLPRGCHARADQVGLQQTHRDEPLMQPRVVIAGSREVGVSREVTSGFESPFAHELGSRLGCLFHSGSRVRTVHPQDASIRIALGLCYVDVVVSSIRLCPTDSRRTTQRSRHTTFARRLTKMQSTTRGSGGA
jgi:hypothetical protein